MYPAQFEYYEANSVEEALGLLDEHEDREVELLAGGHSLLPTMKTGLASPDVLIDMGGIDDLVGIENGGGSVTIGALTRYADVAKSDVVHEAAPAVGEAAAAIGDIQVRNRGTVGGNIAHSDPASDLPGAVLASNATVHVQGPDGNREIPIDDFFLGMYMTGLEEDEILTGVELPSLGDGVGVYLKKPSPSSGYAMIGVAAVLELDGGTVSSARVAANGAIDHAVRLDPVESALQGESLDSDVIEDAAEQAADDLDETLLLDDIQASSEYRAQLLRVYTRRALEAAADRA